MCWLAGPGCRILGIFATRYQVYGAHGCHLACLVHLLWRPGGPWDDTGTILGHWKAQGKTLYGPGLDFIDFLLIWGTDFDSFLGSSGPKKKMFSYLFSGCFFLMILGSEFGCPGLQKQAFGMESIAKNNFRRNLISCDSRVIFS